MEKGKLFNIKAINSFQLLIEYFGREYSHHFGLIELYMELALA